MATTRVLSIHFVDMLTHRWDLARALDRPCHVPDHLATAALPIARAITTPDSPLTGPNGAYAPRDPENATRPTLDNIAALLGRDPTLHHIPRRSGADYQGAFPPVGRIART